MGMRAKRQTVPREDFASVARRLGCDEDRARFERKLGKIAKAKPNGRKRRAPTNTGKNS